MRLIDGDALIKKCGDWYVEEGPEEGFIGTLKALVDTMPTITPDSDDEWILCSERMPEEREVFGSTISDPVYVTVERPDGRRFVVDIVFENERPIAFDRRKLDVFYRNPKLIAWKPRPEPYMGDVMG